jgi:membrane dipeptidase
MTETWDVSEQATALHRDAFVCDFTLPYTDLGDAGLKRALLPRFARSGVDFVSLSVGGDGFDAGETVKKIAQERVRIQAAPDLYRLIDTADDMLAAQRDGAVGVAFDLQGTGGLDGALGMVEAYYVLGVRHMLMAYNLRNAVGDGCMEPSDAGLSYFGRRVVAEMNRVGMLVDVAHTGKRTAMDTLAASSAPVIVSHGNAVSVHPHPRNIDDELIKAVAESGGVVGVLGVSNMVNPQYDVSAARLVEHIDHMVQSVGPDHVGLSLDYVYDQPFIYEIALAAAGGAFPPGSGYRPDMPLAEPEDYPRITQAMLDRGYDETTIRKILGLNWHRVAKAVWRPAAGDARDVTA